MTRTAAGLRLALALVATSGPATLAAQDPSVVAEQRVEDNSLYTVEELDNLLAPVALYPDPILAQLLVAATFPEQVQLAARYVATYGTDGIDDQAWDVSVKSIARYEPVLNMLVERPNWATALGRAYALQPGDVMASVQSLRRMARAQGNLVSTEQQRVEVEREAIRIVPAQPRIVYVPVYDPYVIYHEPVYYARVHTPHWSFGVGYPIGVWLNYDLDWTTRVVFYHGWGGHGHRYRHTWYHVSRPYISYSGIYINSNRTIVVINRNVVRRHVRYDHFDRYNYVHRRTSWDRRDLPGRGYNNKPGLENRYGIPTYGNSGVDKPGKFDRGSVPKVSRNDAPSGDRPSGGFGGRGSGPGGRDRDDDARGNGGRDRDDDARGGRGGSGRGIGGNGGNGGRGDDLRAAKESDRVTPVRVGGTRRPLYPGSGEDISPDRVKATPVARREGSGGSGTWNVRPSGKGDAPRATPRTSAGQVAPRFEPDRSAPRISSGSAPRSSGSRMSAPREEVPREYSPRASSPRSSEPRMGAPRSSAPRVSAPRSSEPRASAPRSSAPRVSAPRSSAPKSSPSRGGSSSKGGSRKGAN